jgi:hypothetical protein
MTESTQSETSRRDFLQKALIFTGAGLALGGVAAYAKGRMDAASTSAAAPEAGASIDALSAQLTESNNQAAMLQQALNASEAALAQLRPQLNAALAQNVELQDSLTRQQTEAEALRAQLAEAQATLDKHKQLLALFDQLEGFDVDTVVAAGLASASAGMAGLLSLSPLVADGVKLARALFDNFEKQFPTLRASLDWLKSGLDSMNAGILTVETAIAQAITNLDPIATRMTQLVGYILDNLPFGIGKSVKAALDANDSLYGTLPSFVAGARTQIIAQFVDPYSDTEKGLSKAMLKPIREKAFDSSDKLSAQVTATAQTFVNDLHIPATAALDKRAAKRKEIATFRDTNKI